MAEEHSTLAAKGHEREARLKGLGGHLRAALSSIKIDADSTLKMLKVI